MTSKYDDLEKLADLKNKGIITEEEFKIKKAQILNQDDNIQDNVHEPIHSDNNGKGQSYRQAPVAENKFSGSGFKIIAVIINIIILGALILTNPTKADFQSYISNRMQKSSGNTEDTTNKFLGALATLAVNQITERDNYFVCSIFTVNMTYLKMFSDKTSNNPKFLGIFGQFIPLNVAFKDKEDTVDQKVAPVPTEASNVETPVAQSATSVELPLVSPSSDLAKIVMQYGHMTSEEGKDLQAARFDINSDGADDILYITSYSCGSCGCQVSILINQGNGEYVQNKCYIYCGDWKLNFSNETFKGMRKPVGFEYDCIEN